VRDLGPLSKARALEHGVVDWIGGNDPSTVRDLEKESAMDAIWLALFWTGPIGVGVFLPAWVSCLGNRSAQAKRS